jgi:polar amino acid transport system substrate-binding protein
LTSHGARASLNSRPYPQTLLTSNASQCAATGKKPWTVQYFGDSAPIFLGLANGKADLYLGPTF